MPLVELTGKLLPLISLHNSAKQNTQKMGKAVSNIEHSTTEQTRSMVAFSPFPQCVGNRELHETNLGNQYEFGFLVNCLTIYLFT